MGIYVFCALGRDHAGGSEIQYTYHQAPWLNGDGTSESANNNENMVSDDVATVDLGNVSDDAARWWAAVLAPGEGWNASIPHNGRQLKSPWSINFKSDHRLALTRHTDSALPIYLKGTSFSVSAQYISQCARYHNVVDQSSVAFLAALLLPASQSLRKQICLPVRWFVSKPCLKISTPCNPPDADSPWGQDKRQLDRLLTLGCNSIGITSLLSSIFVELDLPCNVCGAWLQGAFAVLTSERVRDPHMLAHIFMKRSPQLGFLWLGSLFIGIQDAVTRWARPAIFLIDIHAAAWTNTTVSFIQEPVSRAAQGSEMISRADEARLTFLSKTEHHAQIPTVPFGPFGNTVIKDCVLEVQLHAQCKGSHGLRYVKWTWDGQDEDQATQSPLEAPKTYEELSAGADGAPGDEGPVLYHGLDREKDCSDFHTRNMFLWLRGTDGFPVAERVIREHEWVEDWDSDEESAAPEGDGRSTTSRAIGPWISRTVTQRCNSL